MTGDDLDRLAEVARRMKLERVQMYGGGRVEEACDMPAVVTVERDGEQIAVVTTEMSERDAARFTCYQVAASLRPTVVYLLADSRMRFMPTETDEGTLKHGELQEDWNAGRRAGITEVMTITRIPKEGEVTCRYFPYKRTGKKLRWLEPISPDQGTRIEGALIDYTTAGFTDGRYTALFEEFASDPDAATSIDRAACRFLSTQPFIARVRLVRDNDWPADILYIDGTSLEPTK